MQVAKHGARILRKVVWWVHEFKNIALPSKETLEVLAGAAEIVFVSKASQTYFQQALWNQFNLTVQHSRFHVIHNSPGEKWLKHDCKMVEERKAIRLRARKELGLGLSDYIVLYLGQVDSY